MVGEAVNGGRWQAGLETACGMRPGWFRAKAWPSPGTRALGESALGDAALDRVHGDEGME